jgi:preprotein translocase subunit SecD
MKTTTIKVAVLSVILLLLASACSRTTQRGRSYSLDPSKPQFTISPADLAAPPVLGTNSTPSGEHATIVLRIQFTAAKAEAFDKFTRDHKNQQTQLVVRSKVIARPYVAAEIPDGRVELAFSSIDDAREARVWLSKK